MTVRPDSLFNRRTLWPLIGLSKASRRMKVTVELLPTVAEEGEAETLDLVGDTAPGVKVTVAV